MGSDCTRVGTDQRDILYTSCAGTAYRSVHYHRSGSATTHPKSIWVIERLSECKVFCEAERSGWKGGDGALWYVAPDDETDLGTRRERLAHFYPPSTGSTDWHGHPVGYGRHALEFDKKVPDDLLLEWRDSRRIKKSTYQRLLDGRI